MNFLELTQKRYSVRCFQTKAVEPEKLEYVMQAVRNAPSACNRQPWLFYMVNDEEKLASLHQAYDREWFRTAPLCIVACGNHDESWHRQADGKDACDIDVAIAVTHLTLAAAEQGLGSCWICNFDTKKCAAALQLPANMEPVALIPIGYPDTEQPEKSRKDFGQILNRDFWK